MLVVVRLPVETPLPDVAFVPLHPPPAVQDAASVEDHVRRALVLYAIEVGLAESVAVGTDGVGRVITGGVYELN